MHPVASWRVSAFRAFAVAAVGLAGLTGCTMVGDSLTGVSLKREQAANCIPQCNEAAKLSIDEEMSLHLGNVEECKALPESEQQACFDAEGARHAAAMQSITDTRRECHNNCHSQGRGSAG